jgi:NAD(P)H dehydrogenase (quinone)
MNVLIVLVHPDTWSLNASLARDAKTHLEALGHSVEISDLYGQGFKPLVDREDYDVSDDSRLFVLRASRDRVEQERVPRDILDEQEKVLRADAVIFQFPIWWYAIPAMLKGWFERVYSHGFGYGLGVYSDTRWGDRFGEGRLVGKRAMVSTTMGGMADHYSDRGINGPIEDLLYPVNHNLLFYTGFNVLEPHLVFRADHLTEADYVQVLEGWRSKLERLFEEQPIAYRFQNGGDYHIPSLRLRDGLEHGSERSLFDLHRKIGPQGVVDTNQRLDEATLDTTSPAWARR